MAWKEAIRTPGEYISKCDFPGHILNAGEYSVSFGSDMPPYTSSLVTTKFCLHISIEDIDGHGSRRERLPGIIKPKIEWNVNQLSLK